MTVTSVLCQWKVTKSCKTTQSSCQVNFMGITAKDFVSPISQQLLNGDDKGFHSKFTSKICCFYMDRWKNSSILIGLLFKIYYMPSSHCQFLSTKYVFLHEWLALVKHIYRNIFCILYFSCKKLAFERIWNYYRKMHGKT